MKKSATLILASIGLLSALLFGFQNCASNKMPDVNVTAASVSPAKTLLPNYNPAMTAGTQQTITALNAAGTLSFQILPATGICSVDPVSGQVTAAATVSAQGICTVQITDAGGSLPALATITVSPAQQVITITPGSQTYDAATTTTFSVPNFTSMTIEVYGAGGGGGGLTYLMGGFATNGASGGTTSVSGTGVSLGATGGSGGSAGAVRSGAASGGAGGAGVGGASMLTGSTGGQVTGGRAAGPSGGAGGAFNTVNGFDQQGQPGGAPGGGGGGRGYAATPDFGYGGGGGGGGYASVVVTPSQVAAGTTLTITVGAGGVSGAHSSNPTSPQGGSGANGRVVITWN